MDGIGNLVELNGRFAAELDAPVLMVRWFGAGRHAFGEGQSGTWGSWSCGPLPSDQLLIVRGRAVLTKQGVRAVQSCRLPRTTADCAVVADLLTPCNLQP